MLGFLVIGSLMGQGHLTDLSLTYLEMRSRVDRSECLDEEAVRDSPELNVFVLKGLELIVEY